MELEQELEYFYNAIDNLCKNNNVDKSHGLEHAIQVKNNGINTLRCWNSKYKAPNEKESFCVLLACLLHDVDDSKYFTTSIDLENAKNILHGYGKLDQKSIDLVLLCISLVSASKNRDNVQNIYPRWVYIPRMCDRIEATGICGVERCLEYTLSKNMPLYVAEDPRPKTIEEVDEFYNEYLTYVGKCRSMIHCYLVRLAHISEKNSAFKNNYIDERLRMGRNYILRIIFKYSEKGKITQTGVKKMIEQFKNEYLQSF